MSEKFTEFNLSTDSYAAFDATTLKSLIKDRLTDKNVFTDHVFEGSNLSSIIDIIAYSYHTLLFYLNRTSSESMFTEAQVYENINRIVKLLNYNPTGYKTSVLSFTAKGSMQSGTYTLPRYSFVDVGGIKYSINSDISFGKTTSTEEAIPSIGSNHLLYQGTFEEYPRQVATGEEFETITLALDSSIKPDGYNIHVYVKNSNTWSEYTHTESLFLESPTALKFEKRLNESKLYEIRFGNDIYGKKLTSGDVIAVYYLKSDLEKGKIAAGALKGAPTPISTSQFLEIRDDIKPNNTVYMSIDNMQALVLTNADPSTSPETEESVSSIKTYSPKFFGMQHRLVTAADFESYINKQYGNIVLDTKVVSNNEYINGHLAYAVNTLSLQKPNLESRILYNQVNFADSTNFNNVYIYAIPKMEKITSATPLVNYVSPAQRNLILNGIESLKLMTAEPIVIDPVYMALDIGAALPTETLTPDMRKATRLNIVKRRDSQRDDDIIKNEIAEIIKKYFGTASRLGYLLDVNKMYNELISVTDVVDLYMTRTDNTAINTQGITFLSWHPAYEKKDISIISQNTQYPYYKFPYMFEPSCLLSKINVIKSVDATTSSTNSY